MGNSKEKGPLCPIINDMESVKGKRALCGVIDDIGPDREEVSEVIRGKRIKNFDFFAQVAAEERFSIIEEVLNETLKPFTNIDFKPNEHDYLINLSSDWRIKKEED